MYENAIKNRSSGKTNKEVTVEKEIIVITRITIGDVDQIENTKHGRIVIRKNTTGNDPKHEECKSRLSKQVIEGYCEGKSRIISERLGVGYEEAKELH